MGPKLLAAKSREAGRQIFEDREHVQIMVKGQKEQVFVREVTQADKDRFPHAYAAFKAGKDAPVIGTPIAMLPGLGPSMVQNMKSVGVRTIEDLAALPDSAVGQLGTGARDFQARAKAMLAQTSAETVKLQQQNDALAKQLADMQQQMAEMQELMNPPPKKRGRKPRAVSDNLQ